MDQCDISMWLIERTLTVCGRLENALWIRHLKDIVMWKT